MSKPKQFALSDSEILEEERLLNRLKELRQIRSSDTGVKYITTPKAVEKVDEASVNIDDMLQKSLMSLDISLETEKLEEKLAQLENAILPDSVKEKTTAEQELKQESHLEKSIRLLEEDVFYRTVDQGSHVGQEEMMKFKILLDQREERLTYKEECYRKRELEFDERVRQANSRLQLEEKKLCQLQKRMEEQVNFIIQGAMKEEKEIERKRDIKTDSYEKTRDTDEKHDQNQDKDFEVKKDPNISCVKLNLIPFSGKEPVPKNETTFEEFKLEFDSDRQIYSDIVLKQALRKSLKDQAKKVMLHLGADATVSNIMRSLEATFGNVASEDSILSKFLLAEQKNEESIVEWSLRLEELILQIERKSKIDSEERKVMMKKRFWRGLKNEELKQATRVHFESKMPYEELRNKVRAEEFEIQLQKDRTSTKPKVGKVNQTSIETPTKSTDEVIEQLIKKVESMDKRLEEIAKHYYDRKVKDNKIEKGDRVLVKNVRLKGKHKLADIWSDKVFVVQDQPDQDIPVFRLIAEDGSGDSRTIHRNNILLINHLPIPELSDSENNSVQTDSTLPSQVESDITNLSSSDSSSDIESPGKYIPPHRKRPGQAGLQPRRTTRVRKKPDRFQF